MSFWVLLRRGLFHHRRTNTGLVLTACVGAMVLTGALMVGDSVRFSLSELALVRLGRSQLALFTEDRFFPVDLADRLALSSPGNEDLLTAPVLQIRGIGIKDALRIPGIQITGVEDRFWEIGDSELFPMSDGEGVVNRALADRLGVEEGDELLIRAENQGAMPADAPLAVSEDTSVSLRLVVAGIAEDERFGRFSLRSSHVSPMTVFVPLSRLGQAVEQAGRANLLLAASRSGLKLSRDSVQKRLERVWRLSDGGIELLPSAGAADGFGSALEGSAAGQWELRSRRVFIEPAVSEHFGTLEELTTTSILTYFVNSISVDGDGQKQTPYSFIAGLDGPPVPKDMADDEILINRWLADDLGVGAGDDLRVDYTALGQDGALAARGEMFRVKGVVPTEASDPGLMPDFPGLADAASCRDWEPGVPLDLERIRDKDQDYWETFHGAPKAFVTLRTAQRMWANRFGNVTAIRFSTDAARIESLGENFDPALLGFSFQAVRDEGTRAGMGAVDFGQLFLGLSFFLIASTLMMTGLVFLFGAENRSEETGLLLAVGFSAVQVRRLLLIEGAILAVLGGLPGAFLGIGYNRLVLMALTTVWKGAVGAAEFRVHVRLASILAGALGSITAGVLTVWLFGRRLAVKPVTELQQPGARYGIDSVKSGERRWISPLIAGAGISGGGLLVYLFRPGSSGGAAGAFFTAGALFLIGGLALFEIVLNRIGSHNAAGAVSLSGMGLRNCGRRRKRSLFTAGLLAVGIFSVAAVGLNRTDPLAGAELNSSGTGGFTFYAETALPVFDDLGDAGVRRKLQLDAYGTEDLNFHPFRLKEGDDASCLNLNQVQNPSLVGVSPESFAERAAFSFVKVLGDGIEGNPWLLLSEKQEDGTVPAIADQTVIVWGLKKKVGDTLSYTDEQGNSFELKIVAGLANSIFQGHLLISETAFLDKFPSAGGSRVFLIDSKEEDTTGLLQRSFRDYGIELETTAERLARFNVVQNTYLTIFLMLGGLGLVLGCIGMAVVVLRNAAESRGELALLRAVGFSRRSVYRILLSEHVVLLAAGSVLGVSAAVISVLPSLLSPGAEVPFSTLGLVVAAAVLNGIVWILAAAGISTGGNLLSALRDE